MCDLLHHCWCAGPPLQSRLKTAGALTLLAAVSVTAAHVPLEQARPLTACISPILTSEQHPCKLPNAQKESLPTRPQTLRKSVIADEYL